MCCDSVVDQPPTLAPTQLARAQRPVVVATARQHAIPACQCSCYVVDLGRCKSHHKLLAHSSGTERSPAAPTAHTKEMIQHRTHAVRQVRGRKRRKTAEGGGLGNTHHGRTLRGGGTPGSGTPAHTTTLQLRDKPGKNGEKELTARRAVCRQRVTKESRFVRGRCLQGWTRGHRQHMAGQR